MVQAPPEQEWSAPRLALAGVAFSASINHDAQGHGFEAKQYGTVLFPYPPESH